MSVLPLSWGTPRRKGWTFLLVSPAQHRAWHIVSNDCTTQGSLASSPSLNSPAFLLSNFLSTSPFHLFSPPKGRPKGAYNKTRMVPQLAGAHNFPIPLSKKPELSPSWASPLYFSAPTLIHDEYDLLWLSRQSI